MNLRTFHVSMAALVLLAASAPATAGSTCEPCPAGLVCSQGQCKSSVKDASSPLYSRSCTLTQHLSNPTSLPGDCRCLDNRAQTNGIDACKRPYDAAKSGTKLGDGPSFGLLPNAHISGGFIDSASNTLIASVYWDGSSAPKGLVVSYDLSTWGRRFVSGEWKNELPQQAGSGPAFTHLKDIRPGADGKWYALSYKPQKPQIFRVDPTTGARSVIWTGGEAGFGQCASGDPKAQGKSVQYTADGFAVDADGSFLLGYANPQRDGRGIVRISANGASCSYVTASGKRADGMTRGVGDEMRGFVQGFALHDGAIWAFTTGEKRLWAVDPATGDRRVKSTTAVGERWAVWDAKRAVLWTAGLQNSVTVGAFDPATGRAVNVFKDAGKVPWLPLAAEGPIRINSLNYGPMFVNPATGTLLLGHDSIGLLEFEPETGNSFVRSL